MTSTSTPGTVLDSTEVRGILAKTDPALLLNCLVQLTGDVTLLDRYGQGTLRRHNPSRRLMPDSHMPADSAATVVGRLAALLTDQAPRAEAAITVPDPGLFRRMTELAVGQEPAPEFLPLLLEQAGFQLDQPAIPITRRPPDDFDVAIIGAGMSGIHAAISAARRGLGYRVFERARDIGGTWRINTYPGAAVDTPSLYYSFSYELNPEWTHFYPAGPQYQAYLQRVVDRYHVARTSPSAPR